jgi:hypothetical protein
VRSYSLPWPLLKQRAVLRCAGTIFMRCSGLPVAVKDLTPVKGLPFTQVSAEHPLKVVILKRSQCSSGPHTPSSIAVLHRTAWTSQLAA